jgi:hypothetical protein
MRRSIAISAALAALAPVAAAYGDAIDFSIVSQEVTVDRDADVANFTVTFSRTPLFVEVDANDGDVFQYEIDADSTDANADLPLSDVDAVIRGGEIFEGKGIPVREPAGLVPDPDAGGWGPIRALLPFDLDDNIITFSAPLSALGATDGSFRYRALTIENGELTSRIVGATVPTPAALGPGLALLGGVMALRAARRRII